MKRLLVCSLVFVAACESSSSGPFDDVPVATTLTAKGLSAPVEVVRDETGIPHIRGKTLPDVAYAEGYVMAQDRMVQMDLSRRSGAGELAELVGALSSSVLASDIQMRSHHMRSTSQAVFDQLEASSAADDQELVATLTAFAAGVNAYIADLKANKYLVPGDYSSFYDAQTIAPWTEVDTIVLGRLLAFQLSFDGASDALRSLLDTSAAALSGDPLRAGIGADLQIMAPIDPTYTLPSGWTGTDGTSAKRDRKKRRLGPSLRSLSTLYGEQVLAMRDLGRQHLTQPDKGSNNFVIAPSKSTTGHALVANDTHLQLSNPPIFYLVHLTVAPADAASKPLNVMGVQFPGVPGIILGMNDHIAWGATVNNLDVTDTYNESVIACSTGGDVPCVMTKAGEVKLVPRQETFKVGVLGTITSTVTVTLYDVPNHGPITPRVIVPASGPVTVDALHVGGNELSVRWTGHEPTLEVRAILHLDRAANMQEAVAALDADFRTGGQNWVIGDDQGHIGWTQTIRLPRRPAGTIPWKVLPGDGSADWGADLDPKYIPHAFDPAAGFLATANADPIGVTAENDPFKNAPVVDGIPAYLGTDFDPGTRVGRITKRLTATDKLAFEDVQSIQADAITEFGPLFAPTFLDAAGALAEELATPGSHPELTAMLAAAPAGVTALLSPARDKVTGWTFDTPSGIASGEGDTPTSVQIADSQATAIVAAFTASLAHAALDDELTKMSLSIDQIGSGAVRKLLALMCTHPDRLATKLQGNGDSILFDDVTTVAVETKRTTAAGAVLAALGKLSDPTQLGPDFSAWRWGKIHTLTLDGLLPLASLAIPTKDDASFPGGFPRHGDDGTVDVGPHGLSTTDYTYSEGPAIRFACELTPSGPVARNILPGGQTFDPSSPHYRDQMELWRVNQTLSLAFTLPDVVASAKKEAATNPKNGRIRFTPAAR